MFECTEKMTFGEWMTRRDEVLKNGLTVKIGTVQLFPEEAEEGYNRGLYLMTYHKIYQICHSAKRGYYGKVVYKTTVPLTRRGSYYTVNSEYVNGLKVS